MRGEKHGEYHFNWVSQYFLCFHSFDFITYKTFLTYLKGCCANFPRKKMK